MKITIEEAKQKLQEFGKLRQKKDKLKAELKVLDVQIDEMEPGLLDIMDKLKIQNMKMDKIGTFYVQVEAYPQVKDNLKLITWMKDNDRGDIVKETVNYQSLRGIINEQLEANLETPEGVEVFMKREIRLRRDK